MIHDGHDIQSPLLPPPKTEVVLFPSPETVSRDSVQPEYSASTRLIDDLSPRPNHTIESSLVCGNATGACRWIHQDVANLPRPPRCMSFGELDSETHYMPAGVRAAGATTGATTNQPAAEQIAPSEVQDTSIAGGTHFAPPWLKKARLIRCSETADLTSEAPRDSDALALPHPSGSRITPAKYCPAADLVQAIQIPSPPYFVRTSKSHMDRNDRTKTVS